MATREERFSLKDYLFNEKKVEKITSEILSAYPAFESTKFKKQVLFKFPELELLERVYWIKDTLREYLPPDYRTAVKILIESLPLEADPNKVDDDFGDFIYVPYSYFVAEYGCSKKDLPFSLKALKTFTTRCSAEGPIRFFINEFPNETLVELLKWTKDKHYHVRRLACEGTRPLLPWAKKIDVEFSEAIPILDALYSDKTRYITRSVANHMNDISKINPVIAISLLKKWEKSKKQSESEMQYILRHSLRTLVKVGNKEALFMLGYSGNGIQVQKFNIQTPNLAVGEKLSFSFEIVSNVEETQNLMIDYVLHFKKANGSLAPKTFKIAKKVIEGKEVLSIKKKQLIQVMSTRKLYPGEHCVELQINGISFGKKFFTLK